MHRIILAHLALLTAAALPGLAQEKTQRTDAERKALTRIQQLGGLALELAQNDPRLEVSFLQRDGNVSEECLTPLKDLKGLVHLNLAGKDVNDAALVQPQAQTVFTPLHPEKKDKNTT